MLKFVAWRTAPPSLSVARPPYTAWPRAQDLAAMVAAPRQGGAPRQTGAGGLGGAPREGGAECQGGAGQGGAGLSSPPAVAGRVWLS